MIRRLTALAVLLCLAGVAHADQATEANIQTCERFYAEMNKGNLAIIDELVADSFIEHEEFPGLEPTKAGLHKFFQMMRAAFPDLTFTPEFFIAEGNKVVCYGSLTGTHKGQFTGMAATGNAFSVSVADILRWEGGKAVEHWGVSDSRAMMEQLSAKDHDDHGGHKGHDHK